MLIRVADSGVIGVVFFGTVVIAGIVAETGFLAFCAPWRTV